MNRISVPVASLLILTSAACAEAGSISDVAATQNGNTNYAHVEQGADVNILNLTQTGNRNIARAVQFGTSNQASIYQHGGVSSSLLHQAWRSAGSGQSIPMPYFVPSTNRIKRKLVVNNGYATYILRYRNRGFDLLSVSATPPRVGRLMRRR